MDELPASVAGRLLLLFEAFSADRPALLLSELSRRSGLPLSTTHRLVAELREWGALERGTDGRYRVGLRLWELAALCPRGLGLRDAAMPFLEDLYEATHENVQLAVRDGADVVYVERISGRGAVNVLTRVGGRLPVHATGVGLVLLANATRQVQEDVLAGPLKRFTERTICAPEELRRRLSAVRRDGYAVSDRAIELISQSVAVPIHGPEGSVVAALSIVVPADADARALVPAVRAAGRGISRALGAPAARSPNLSVDQR